MFNLKGVSKSSRRYVQIDGEGRRVSRARCGRQARGSGSDMSELKITDLKDARHPGEIAARRGAQRGDCGHESPTVVPTGCREERRLWV